NMQGAWRSSTPICCCLGCCRLSRVLASPVGVFVSASAQCGKTSCEAGSVLAAIGLRYAILWDAPIATTVTTRDVFKRARMHWSCLSLLAACAAAAFGLDVESRDAALGPWA